MLSSKKLLIYYGFHGSSAAEIMEKQRFVFPFCADIFMPPNAPHASPSTPHQQDFIAKQFHPPQVNFFCNRRIQLKKASLATCSFFPTTLPAGVKSLSRHKTPSAPTANKKDRTRSECDRKKKNLSLTHCVQLRFLLAEKERFELENGIFFAYFYAPNHSKHRFFVQNLVICTVIHFQLDPYKGIYKGQNIVFVQLKNFKKIPSGSIHSIPR